MSQIHVGAAVIGASLGGVLAAYQLCRQGVRTLLSSEFAWIGGQLTSQGVPPDEHRYIESFGASESYYRFRSAIRAHYLADRDFTDHSSMTEGCNPGDGWVSRLCFEPAVGEKYLRQLLQRYIDDGTLVLLEQTRPVSAHRQGRILEKVELQNALGQHWQVHADYFLDATDTGELLLQADLEYRLGKESQAEFGEHQAPEIASCNDQQPVTYVFALQKKRAPTADLIPRPESYDFWRSYLVPHYGYPLFGAQIPGGEGFSSVRLPLFAGGETLDLWRYRRIVASHNWRTERLDISLVNWAQNDFARYPLLDGSARTQEQVVAEARQLSQCFLYWLQREAPRSWAGEAGTGFPELVPASYVLGSDDGFAQQVYVRESRRIVGLQTLSQNDIEATAEAVWQPARCDNSVGIGLYNMDIHPTCKSGMGSNAQVRPFELPLGAFIPNTVDNLLPACKNISVTHLVNAATRVHPIEWLIGEVAGLLASYCIKQKFTPASVHAHRSRVADFQRLLTGSGIPLHWPESPTVATAI